MAGKDKIQTKRDSKANTEIVESIEPFVEFLEEYLESEHANVASFTSLTDWNIFIQAIAQFTKEGWTEPGIPGRINVLRKITLQCIGIYTNLVAVDTDGTEQQKALAKAILKKSKMKDPEKKEENELDALKKLIG
tara:strand:+ start:178 stop:582 length:405 start_codon:yes stop_codon:yes gene_type:complete